MDLILNFVQQGVSFIVPLVILLGLLIFVHELGHFLVAVYNGVRVEVFSLGFGKKIFSYKRGYTEYCISIIPFGGYVKMFGDDPTGKVDEAERQHSFVHKRVGQRIAVVLAGPLMNFFFAILLFFVIALVGEDFIRPIVGDLSEKSAAYSSGLRAGDTIISVNGESVKTWDRVQKIVEENANRSLKLEVQRFQTNQVETIEAKATQGPNKNILSTKALIGEIEGLANLAKAAAIGVSGPQTLAAKSGLQSLDQIIAINGTPTPRWVDFLYVLSSEIKKPSLRIDIERTRVGEKKPESLSITFDTTQIDSSKEISSLVAEIGIESSEYYLASVVPDSSAAAAGLQRGDRILKINEQVILEWSDLVNSVKSFVPEKGPLKVEFRRDGKVAEVQVTPKVISQPGPTGHDEKSYAMGVVTALSYAPAITAQIKTTNIAEAAKIGFVDTLHWTQTTVLSFVRLIQNKVSAKSIGGPIMIGQLASKTFQVGISPFLKIMAIISINLFVLNLLPIPVLDGGHLVFFTIEAIKGSPLSLRKMEIAQQIGLALLMGLMVFAIFNDVSRLFSF